jgi:hypothetical protein
MALALTKPDIRLGRSRDPITEFSKIEAGFREKKAKAEARLLDLDSAWAACQWDAQLSPAELNRKIAAIDRDRAAASLEIASATEALTLADSRRALALRASSLVALEELRIERRKLLQATKLDAERLEPLVVEIVALNGRLRAAARLDRDLKMQMIAEMRRGGISDEGSIAPAMSEANGLWLLEGYDQDIQATARDLENAGRDR